MDVGFDMEIILKPLLKSLTKAYNLLLRPLLKSLAPRFGIPAKISQPYFEFLTQLQRRFGTHSEVSEPLPSTVGVPEGCAFAVYHMMQLNWVFVIDTVGLQEQQSSVSFVNYVDNWLFCSYRSQILRHTLFRVHEASS